jgi:hypothetical protein
VGSICFETSGSVDSLLVEERISRLRRFASEEKVRAMLVRSSNLARGARRLCRDFFVDFVVLLQVGNSMKPTRAEDAIELWNKN